MNEHARGSHLVVGGHWHTKGIAQQTFSGFGGESEVTTLISLGTFKPTDEYIRTYGFANRNPKELFGVTVKLDKDKRFVTPYYDTVEAHRQFM